MITEKDKKSLKALELLNQNYKHKHIAEKLNISIDSVKRLSRYNNIINQAEKRLQAVYLDKIKGLGLKIIVLAKLFKNEEYELVKDILLQVDENIKREELQRLPEILKARKDKLEKVKTATAKELQELEEKEKKFEIKLNELEINQKKLLENTKFLGDCDKKTRDFLEDHLGINDEDVVLLKRLYGYWQADLRDAKIIVYNNGKKVWIVKDIEELKRATSERLRNSEKVAWDWNDIPWWVENHPPKTEWYSKVKNVTTVQKLTIKVRKEEVSILKKELKAIRKKIKELKKQGVQSFIQSKEYSNHFSDLEIIRHGVLENEAMKYLYSLDYAAANEIILPDRKRVDIAGFNIDEDIIIIEAKASMSDFIGDKKWKNYMQYCNQYYFIFGSWDYDIKKIENKIEGSGAGILLFNENMKKIEVLKIAETMQIQEDKNKLMFDITRRAGQKIILGF